MSIPGRVSCRELNGINDLPNIDSPKLYAAKFVVDVVFVSNKQQKKRFMMILS